ncbi:thioredoxin [Candidatus Gracilibacteria bacterium]|nr:thioredoxin [Candidatus Gracilibacteria bacterium]
MELTNENFATQTAKGLVLVDFWAEWCGPCQGMMPTLAELEKTGVKVGKVNIEEQSDLAAEYRVMSIPTLLWMKDGKVVDQMIGAQDLATLTEMAEKHK